MLATCQSFLLFASAELLRVLLVPSLFLRRWRLNNTHEQTRIDRVQFCGFFELLLQEVEVLFRARRFRIDELFPLLLRGILLVLLLFLFDGVIVGVVLGAEGLQKEAGFDLVLQHSPLVEGSQSIYSALE